ncbi:sulfatase-like hydrolase/transferase [Dyadobacter sp. CY323]|uniref:sulfatase-like hydrolase/transferase n=1 Tax=Dyadobacter sp. CY323 TaxID=2907302 RepID=UPI001F29EEB3|nr:sulfatase-like hydrolase/transferase [Dyadobacter sp. CY323]MCE6992780.1 sulfatase-like hydrolase/transferase [Dyadobacter sp. CY323]
MKTSLLKSLLLALVASLPAYAQTPRRPNILLIMTDDHGYGDFGFTGNPHVKTPDIDQLAAKSVRLTNFHVSPVCAPTRASLISNIDDNVGRILQELKAQKLEENTIVVFMTDNGNQQLRFNTGFRALKGSVYEGGTRVPLLISGAYDLLPTLLEATRIALPKELKLDGKSALKHIQAKVAAEPRTLQCPEPRLAGAVPQCSCV